MDAREYIQRDVQSRALFRALPEEELRHIAVRTYKRNQRFIHAGDRADALFIVLDGICEVQRNTNIAFQQPQSHLGYLDTVGLYEIIHNISRLGVVVAYRDCTMLEIDRETTLRWMEQYPRFLLELSSGIIQRLHEEIEHINECTKYPTCYGVICSLLWARELLNRRTPEFAGPVKIDYTRQYLADLIGKDIRSVHRAMELLRLKDLITMEHGKIYVSAAQVELLQEEKLTAIDNR